MSRKQTIVLAVRILLFIALGILFVLKGMSMEINYTRMLFIGIGLADFVYAALLAGPFFGKKQQDE